MTRKRKISPICIDVSDLTEVSNFPSTMPLVAMRDFVMFPGLPIPLNIGRKKSLNAINKALETKGPLFCVLQKDSEVEDPGKKDLYEVGVICHVVNVIELGEDYHTALVIADRKGKLLRMSKSTPYLRGMIQPIPTPDFDLSVGNIKMLVDICQESYYQVISSLGDAEINELKTNMKQFEKSPDLTFNFMCVNSPLKPEQKQEILEIEKFEEKVDKFIQYMSVASRKIQLRNEIQMRTRDDLSQMQKEQFLKQEMATIQMELGGAPEENDIENLNKRAAEKDWTEEAQKHFEKELLKLQRYTYQNPEYSILYSYLDVYLNLPWQKMKETEISLKDIEETLNRDHYGLDKVKDRILEHMAVVKLRKDKKAPIICLYGPPGVGKTSLGKSIADALGREYARVSLGGLHDETEIRGHRRTYIGAMPGRIIAALQKCDTGNPVFVLDEIDKVGQDFKGDPSSALLEVLDPEQNKTFHDNYLDYDYDLSNILFIATANDLSTISAPLRDRMEIIELGSYITAEKREIALRHLIPKSLLEHGLDDEDIKFEPDAVEYMIENYTRESGVRFLDKKIAEILRKIARKKASSEDIPHVITIDHVKEYLGKEKVYLEMYENNDFAGVVTGLAWTPVGGDILYIESSLSPGKGEKLTLTGNLGDVMKESATIALQYLKANANNLGIDSDVFAKNDLHIHVPEGAVPKDGPSAGITIATSIASALTRRKVREKTAMTGELTLRGKVLPVGGIKEKILAARRAGITDIVMSSQNKKDIEEINKEYIEGLSFHFVDRAEEVIKFALLDEIAKY